MFKRTRHFAALAAIAGVTVTALFALDFYGSSTSGTAHSEAGNDKLKPARAAYFFRMLRDPATGLIPSGIRTREIAAAKGHPKRGKSDEDGPFFDWTEMGPDVLSGRTRALAVDVRDSQTILAGGVSGGVWKTENGGSTWRLTSEFLGVTSIAQDPRPGHEDTWFFSTGELVGSTGSPFGVSPFYGNGIYKSTDGGDSWSLLPSTVSASTSHDHPFNFTWRARVSPTTGSVFVTGNGFGLYRSTDGGSSFEKVLGEGESEHLDLAINTRGDVLAVLSTSQRYTGFRGPGGIFASLDDGDTWTRIPSPELDDTLHSRSVLAFAESNPDVAFVISEVDKDNPLAIHKIDLASMSSVSRSENVPVTGGTSLRTYGSYTMAIAVSPVDEDFVLIAGINMWRTRDGFATPQIDNPDANVSERALSDRCIDHHELLFDPNEPARLLIGCDQGIWTAADVSQSRPVFRDLGRGYNVSQFYAAAMHQRAGDPRIVGGMQDWGSVAFSSPTFTSLLSVGDGGYAFLGERFAYSSTQFGRIYRHQISDNGGPFGRTEITRDLNGYLFITPFVVDPVSEKIIYYPVGSQLFRNRSIESTLAERSWAPIDDSGLPEHFFITAMAASIEPANVLYYASFHPPLAPMVTRLAGADTANGGAMDISIPGAPVGAYPSSIGVNPEDGDEVVVTLSNYNVVGVYHSSDGGSSWTAVEGNLEGTSILPGPSIRSATILPLDTGTAYLIGTSTGVYSTDDLRGMSTVWVKEGHDVLGNAVVAHISSRTSDGRVLAATHGRGIFTGDRNSAPVSVEDDAIVEMRRTDLPHLLTGVSAYPNPMREKGLIGFTLEASTRVRLALFDVAGRSLQTGGFERSLPPGRHAIPLDSGELAPGNYLVRLEWEGADGGTYATGTRFAKN